jgi:hypothetical protein
LSQLKTKLEIEEEKKFEEEAFELQCKAIKFAIPGVRNAPDRLVLCPSSRVIFFEFKRKGENPRPGQTWFHQGLMSFGFECHVVYTAEEAIKILKRFLKCL